MAKMNVYKMSFKKTYLTKSNFKEIGFQILLKNIQIWRCFNSVRQHVPKSGSTDREGSVHNASILIVVLAG